jgi:hypothetical protein
LLLLFAPWPVPLPAPGIRHDGYTLVTYDRDGAVQGVDAGFRSSDYGALEAGVLLRAGDHEFLHGQGDLLLVSLERYRGGRPAAADEACTVLVGCERECPDEPGNASACGVCWTRLRIDVGPVRELPLVRFAMWRVDVDAAGSAAAPAAEDRCRDLGGRVVGGFCQALRWPLVPLQLPPGHHTFVATSRWFDGEARGEHACAAGELVYLTLGGELVESYSLARQLGARLHTGYATGRMSFSPEVPDALAGRRVVLRP